MADRSDRFASLVGFLVRPRLDVQSRLSCTPPPFGYLGRGIFPSGGLDGHCPSCMPPFGEPCVPPFEGLGDGVGHSDVDMAVHATFTCFAAHGRTSRMVLEGRKGKKGSWTVQGRIEGCETRGWRARWCRKAKDTTRGREWRTRTSAAGNAEREQVFEEGSSGRGETRPDKKQGVLDAVEELRRATRKERKTYLIQSEAWEKDREAILRAIENNRDSSTKGNDGENEYETLRRSLRTLEKEIQRQKELLGTFLETHSTMWESLVVQHRKELSDNFFQFLVDLQDSSIDQDVQDGLATLYTKLLTLCEIHDSVTKDEEIMAAASEDFTDVLNVESLGEAEAKIDRMAAEGRLSPAFMLTMAKAWAGAKESDMTRDEVKDVLAHLYFRARDNMARQQPKEARIMKYLLTIEDKTELRTRLTEAFTEAPEYETATEDYLSTTPDKLLKVVDAVLQAYRTQGKSPMIKDAAGLMRPDTIKQIEELRAIIASDYF